MKLCLFKFFGFIWMAAGLHYSINMRMKYGSGLPKTTEEWLAEIFVGMLFIAGSVMLAVSQYLRKP